MYAFASRTDPFVPAGGPLPGAAPDGDLVGFTFAAKDNFAVANWPAGSGSPDWRARHPPATSHAPALQSLLRAGAQFVGRTVMDELAYGIEGINAHHGAPANPVAPGRLCGGSSCGSASAVAAGRVRVALGTDTAGSIRVPASWTGLFGWRPSYGRVDGEGVTPLAPAFDTVGCLARTGADLHRVGAILLDTVGRRGDELPRPLRLIRDAFDLVEPALRPDLERAAERLGAHAGGWVRVSSPIDLTRGSETLRVLQARGIAATLGPWIRSARPGFAPWIRERFAAALAVDGAAEKVARVRAGGLLAALDAELRAGWLCMPTTPGAPVERGAPPQTHAEVRGATMQLVAPASLGGLPQVVIPVRTRGRVPAGISVVGRRGDDEALLAFASRFIRNTDGVAHD